MSGPGEGKIKLGKADVYLHLKGKSGATVTHVDIELDELNDIIKPGENTYVGAKKGGVFLGLKKEMISRAEKKAKKKDERKNKLIIEWAATVLTIAGAILNALLIKEGFYIWGLSNILWIVFGIKYKHWGLALTFFVLLVINIVGLVYWN